jgi:hypothetical protein
MRAYELLTEYRSTPTALKMMASRISALAGMELEMYISTEEGDGEFEIDLEQDESVYSMDEIYDFFYDGDHNSRQSVQRVVNEMNSDYQEWLVEQSSEKWDREDHADVVRDYILNNIMTMDDFREQWMENERTSEDQKFDDDDISDGAEKLLNDMVEEALDSDLEGHLENARDEWIQDWLENADEETEWLREQGILTMSDVPDHYSDLSWPHYTNTGEANLYDIEQEIRSIVKNTYEVTTDSSLDGYEPEADMAGIEIISPPLQVDQLFSDFRKIIRWAQSRGAITTSSTGLHMNVSVANYSREQLDYLKLAILIGDEYILEKFGRLGNSYTRSAIEIIKLRMADDDLVDPKDIEALLSRMKTGMDQLATKVIHSGYTDKYTSINTKHGWVEFRAPGNDWLDMNVDELEATMHRYIVALDAAMDPNKFRREYLKKLYKLFKTTDNATDPLHYFSRYVAGELTKEDLKIMVNSIRSKHGKKISNRPPKWGDVRPDLENETSGRGTDWAQNLRDRLESMPRPRFGPPEDA